MADVSVDFPTDVEPVLDAPIGEVAIKRMENEGLRNMGGPNPRMLAFVIRGPTKMIMSCSSFKSQESNVENSERYLFQRNGGLEAYLGEGGVQRASGVGAALAETRILWIKRKLWFYQ